MEAYEAGSGSPGPHPARRATDRAAAQAVEGMWIEARRRVRGMNNSKVRGALQMVRSDLDGVMGEVRRVLEFLNHKRDLSRSQVEALRCLPGIPAEVLLGLDR